MIQFRHTRISKSFIEACGEAVLSGRSIVLLGPRFGGKRYVHGKLYDRLSVQTDAPIFLFSIRTGDRVPGLKAIAYRRLQRGRGGDEQHRGDPLTAISQEVQEGGEPAVLLAANVDRLPPEAARNFLERIRAMVESRSVTAVLSGTLDFRDLVSGPHSEFNCADQFVLQGFDQETFAEEMIRYSGMHRVEWTRPSQDLKKLWQFTGGNRHLGRLLVMVAAEEFAGCRKKDAEACERVFQRALKTDSIPSTYWSSLLHGPADLIAGAPDCWADVELLMAEGRVGARALDGAPGELELSGIAIREGGTLHFASEFAERLVRSHFTATRLGDLYAKNGQWVEALKRYGLRDEEGVRPVDREDRAALEGSVQALGAAMFAAAGGGVENVRDLFVSGAEALLGFSEISFWSRLKEGWTQEGSPKPVPEGYADGVKAYLESAAESAPLGLLLLPDSIGRFAAAAILQSKVPEWPYVVVLSGLGKRAVLSRDRNALASKLLTLFAGAHDHAMQAQLNLHRLEIRNHHVEILNQIFDFLGGPACDIRKILELTGEGLLKLGYRRVMFCLVDSRRERIQGVLDIPGTHQIDLAEHIDCPLTGEITDLQQWVCHAAKARIVPDVRKEVLAAKKFQEDLAIKAIAIVPILDRQSQVLGTIHIERQDGAVPTQQEVEDLELFGRQLARIFAQNERMTLIQESMDESNAPMMITGPTGALVYANGTAAQQLSISAGWQKTPVSTFPAGDKLVEGIGVALAQQRTSVHQVDDFGREKSYRGEVGIAPLRDWRGQTIGCFVDVHDLRWLHNVIEALTKIGPAQSTEAAIEALFEAVGSFGYQGIRLYVVDSSGKLLRSKKASGLRDEEALRRFNAGEIALSSREDKGVHTWHVLDTGEPAIYHWGETDEITCTKAGLIARSLANSEMPPELGKNRGDWWFEVPLYIGKTEYGKISVDCTSELQPEAFETMRVLVQQSRTILEACQERENLASEHENAVREGLERSMAAVAHNLGSRLAALPIILARFQQREDKYPELAPINQDFSFLVDQSMGMIGRVRELLGKITLRYSKFDVVEIIRRALSSCLTEEQYAITGGWSGVIEADSGVVESALVELIQNSRQFARTPSELKVEVRLDASTEDRIKLEYLDNGPGVLEEHKKRIFEEFFGHRPGMKKSTGLGLSFVRKALASHGGNIIEDGTAGFGVHFVMEIPIQKPAQERS